MTLNENEDPTPAYRFKVTIGDQELAFASVSGLEIPPEIAAKAGIEAVPPAPESADGHVITFTDGSLQDQAELARWLDPTDDTVIGKRDISISLTDDAGTELFVTWNVVNAFPINLTAPDFNAVSNEVAIESLDLVADRFTVK
ncbi:phage tail protein [Kitasatospora sp. NPDC127067]|uniref:phage tail protein n=1 Tax=Kitasatospora sp. NPDC127067 TaxID=3347126 RepID=UPI003661E03F